jgi:hypothetical protein
MTGDQKGDAMTATAAELARNLHHPAITRSSSPWRSAGYCSNFRFAAFATSENILMSLSIRARNSSLPALSGL